MDQAISSDTIKRRQRIRIALALGSAVAVLTAAWSLNALLSPSVALDEIRVSVVRRGDVANTINASGVVIPVHEEQVSSPIDTRVAVVHVKAGQEVAAGDLLLELDDHTIKLAVDSLEEQIAQQKIRVQSLTLEMQQKHKQLASEIELLELDPRYVGWQITTAFKVPGTARVDGVEFNARHSLAPFGAWGRHFSVFANGTKLKLKGGSDSDFSGFIPESANWGLDYTRRPFSVMLKWNYRGEQRQGRVAAFGPDAYEYSKARTRLDVNVDYQLRANLFLYASAQNVFDVPETLLRFGSQTPGYARVSQVLTTGVQLTLGVKGTF